MMAEELKRTVPDPKFEAITQEAFREFCARLKGEEFEPMDSLMGGTKLCVTVKGDAKDIAKELKYAARALAKECNRLEFTAFGSLPLPWPVENATRFKSENISMRFVKAYDVMKNQFFIRLDVIGMCEFPEVEVGLY